MAKAARFVDATRRDSLPGVIPHLTRSARPLESERLDSDLPTIRVVPRGTSFELPSEVTGDGSPNGTRGICAMVKTQDFL